MMTICAIIFAVALPVYDFATNSIAERIAGADPAVCLSRFADYPPSKGRLGFPRCLFQKPFPENEKFWLKGVDFSCASPWNDSCGAQRAGTLISKRHVIFAKHFPLWKGVRILFVDAEGEVCPCRIEATKALERSDIMVGLLDYEVTPNIHPAKILPEDYARYIGDGEGLPLVTFDQQERATLTALKALPTGTEKPWLVRSTAQSDRSRESFRKAKIGGDSGNPTFLLLGGDAILLCCLTNGGLGSGSAVHCYRKEVQAAMDELCPGYQLEAFDFASVGR